jgi:hypothetical protein
MVRWPGDKERAEEVYHALNEMYSNLGGTYPVGQNECWHSGIHIYSNMPVYPVTNGTLIACRINKEYIPVSMPDKITADEHKKLGADKQEFYQEERTEHGLKVYQLIDENSKDLITGGFMLLKHHMYIPTGENGISNKLDFFTLYMNLLPYNEIPELQKYCNEFQPVEEIDQAINVIKQAPFYIKWLFKVNPDKIDKLEYPFKDINGKRVFPSSRFKTKSNIYEGGVLDCEFENDLDPENPVRVNSDWIDVDKMIKRYIPKEHTDVKVYSIKKPEGAPADDYLLTHLKNEANPFFTLINRHPNDGAWNYATGYFKITVFPEEVQKSSRELGLYLPALKDYRTFNSNEEINDRIGSNSIYECTGVDSTKILLKIKNEFTGGVMPIPHEFKILREGEVNYKIVKLTNLLKKLEETGWIQNLVDFFDRNIDFNKDKITIKGMEDEGLGNFIKSITITNNQPTQTGKKEGKLPVDSNKLVIIIKKETSSFDPEKYQESKNQMAFYYGDQQIFPYVDADGIWDDLNSEPSNGLSLYCVTPQSNIFWKDSYLEILKDPSDFSCSCLKNEGGLLPCRISFDGKNSEVLIKATDLQCDYAYGQVKTESVFFDQKIKGLPVYDDFETPQNMPENMREVLTADDEFSLEQTDRFLEAGTAQNRYAVTLDGARRYVVIEDKSFLKMKAGVDTNKYGEDNTVGFPANENLHTGSILGFPTPHKQYTNRLFYDLVVFFKNSDFMNNTEEAQADLFTIPEEVKIYTEQQKVQTAYMFPPDTTFSYEEKGVKDGSAVYELKIESMEIYIFRADEVIKEKEAAKDKEVEIGEFSTIEVYNSYITYDELGGVLACGDDRLKAFANAFGKIRDGIKNAKLKCVAEYKKGEVTEKRFLVEFSMYADFELPFWMGEKDLPNDMEKDNDNKKIIYTREKNGSKELALKVYEENPLEAEFEEAERQGELSGTLELRKTTGEMEDKAHEKYLGFNISDKVIYAMDSEVKKENLLEWNKYFTIFEEENDNDIVCDSPVEDRLNEESAEPLSTTEMAKKKREIVCRHPLDWDREQYTAHKIKSKILLGNEKRHELLLEKMDALEIWNHIKDHEDIKQEKNNFWYGHPVYFINHLERARLLRHPRIDQLLAIQDDVMALECLKQGHKGIYPEVWETEQLTPQQTYCNHGAYLTIKAVDDNMINFTGRSNKSFPEVEDAQSYLYKNSNYWCDILVKQASAGIIRELDEKVAQEQANEGYVVIAVWKNLTLKSQGGGSPHFATVRPGFSFDRVNGPMLANIGVTNDEVRRSRGFLGKPVKDIHWYYNPQQKFQYNPSVVTDFKDFK